MDYYGFTDEELDFIINYDIKFRMGKELGEEEEEWLWRGNIFQPQMFLT